MRSGSRKNSLLNLGETSRQIPGVFDEGIGDAFGLDSAGSGINAVGQLALLRVDEQAAVVAAVAELDRELGAARSDHQ